MLAMVYVQEVIGVSGEVADSRKYTSAGAANGRAPDVLPRADSWLSDSESRRGADFELPACSLPLAVVVCQRRSEWASVSRCVRPYSSLFTWVGVKMA